jgi:hypothetical protein
MMSTTSHREIPYNYTSADDRQVVTSLVGRGVWQKLEALRERRVTGRSARLLLRVFGEVLVHRRNAYLRQELLDSLRRRERFFKDAESNLRVVQENAGADALVLDVLADARRMLDAFREEVRREPDQRGRIRRALGAVVGKENVLFDPFTLVAHATDATDWRLHLPAAVVTPTDESQVGPLLFAIRALGLHAIPRGAGTGLTGGAIPLTPDCVMVNTEKLNHIRGVEVRDFPQEDGRVLQGQVLSLEAGVIT